MQNVKQKRRRLKLELKVEMEEGGGCLLQVAHLAAPHRGVFKSRSASNVPLLPQARQMSAA